MALTCDWECLTGSSTQASTRSSHAAFCSVSRQPLVLIPTWRKKARTLVIPRAARVRPPQPSCFGLREREIVVKCPYVSYILVDGGWSGSWTHHVRHALLWQCHVLVTTKITLGFKQIQLVLCATALLMVVKGTQKSLGPAPACAMCLPPPGWASLLRQGGEVCVLPPVWPA